MLTHYLMSKPHVLAHIRHCCSSERFEMETMAVKAAGDRDSPEAIMARGSRWIPTDRFVIALSPAPLRTVSVNAAKARGYLPHQSTRGGENRLRIRKAATAMLSSM